MSMKKMVALATTVLSGTIGLGGVAHAQSTGSQVQEDEIVVTAQQRRSIEGQMTAETAAKARATITQEYIERQNAGQSIIVQLNTIPGVTVTSSDAYGSSGGNVTLRGLDGPRVSLSFDGIPLNDTGNYAIFLNQMLDPEYITRANVNMGTTDVDSPTASATGGTINYVTRRPKEEGGLTVQYSNGSFDFDRFLTIVDIGEIEGLRTSAFAGASYTNYDKFKGPGEIEKQQYNARIYQPIGEGDDFVSVSFHYNQNRNNFYRPISLDQFKRGITEFDNLATCTRPTPVFGTAQSDAATPQQANIDPLGSIDNSCTNYFNLRINPSNTGNIRVNSRFTLFDNFTLTIDPSFQYVLANGGGFGTFSETDNRLQGVSDTGGVDLNGDGDTLDTIALYTPNNTNTRRWGVLSSLIWDINPDQRVRVAYSWDKGRHRQTGEVGFLGANGDPENVFGGRDGRPVTTRDGSTLRGRDRLSFAELNQWSAEYRGTFFDDMLTVNVGARSPIFTRTLNNFCYQGPAVAATGTTPSNTASGNVVCTTNLATATAGQTGSIFTGSALTTNLQAPGRTKVKYNEVLPSFGISFRPLEQHQFYLSYAEGLSAPRTDDLYSFNRANLAQLRPEQTKSWDLGWRFRGDDLLASVSVYSNDFSNRIQVSRDPTDPTLSVSRNVGKVKIQGWDAEVGWLVTEAFSVYGNVAYNDATFQTNILNGPSGAQPNAATDPVGSFWFLRNWSAGADGTFNTGDDVINTRGKRLPETPEWTASVRANYEIGDFSFGAQARWTDTRFFNFVNDPRAKAPAFITLDADARWDITDIIQGTSRTYVQFNVTNLLDKDYIGNMNTAALLGGGTASASNASGAIGAPRAIMVTLRTDF